MHIVFRILSAIFTFIALQANSDNHTKISISGCFKHFCDILFCPVFTRYLYCMFSVAGIVLNSNGNLNAMIHVILSISIYAAKKQKQKYKADFQATFTLSQYIEKKK